MNEIFTRRSLRRFTDQPLSQQELEQLLRAAMQAPSAGNSQPWEFVVVKNKVARLKIKNLKSHIYRCNINCCVK